MTINIEWEYFLGIMVALIAIAWYSNGRFTALETSMKWVKETLHDLKVASDNTPNPAFGSDSPIGLKPLGEEWLVESGLKEYLDDDTRKSELMNLCEEKRETNPYEVQMHVFRTFDTLVFNPTFDSELKKFAFDKGTTMNILRRIGAIYFRGFCLDDFGMKEEDIDKHTPKNSNA